MTDPVIERQAREREALKVGILGSDLASRKLRLTKYLTGFNGAYMYTRCTPAGDLKALLSGETGHDERVEGDNPTTLSPCPFCGGQADIHRPILPMAADCDDIVVRCDDCGATGAPVLFDQDVHGAGDLTALSAEAAGAWNIRTNLVSCGKLE